MLHVTLLDDVQEAYNLIQDLMPTTPQVRIFLDTYNTLIVAQTGDQPKCIGKNMPPKSNRTSDCHY